MTRQKFISRRVCGRNCILQIHNTYLIRLQVQRNAETMSNYVPHYQNVIVELRDEVSRLKTKINERNFRNETVVENPKAKQLKDRMIATFEERMKLR